MKKRTKKILLSFLPGILILIIWQVYIDIHPKNEFYLGSPQGIGKEFYFLLFNGDLLHNFSVTIWEAVIGFLLGTIIGTSVGLGLWLSKTAYDISRPYLIILGSLPVFALGPILIFWFGTGILSKIVIGFLTTFAIALGQAYNGAVQVDKNLVILIQSFGGNRMDLFRKIVVPSSLIWVLAGIRINISMALLGAFVGEFISSKAGLGYQIIVAEGLFNVNQIWVGIIGLIVIALLFNFLTLPIEKWAKRWS